MKKKLSIFFLSLVLLCCVLVSSCTQNPSSDNKNPKELISAFMEQYFNVSLEDAQKKIKQKDTKMPLENAFTKEGLKLAAKNRASWQMLKLSEQFQTDITLMDSSATLVSYSKPAFSKKENSSRYEFEATIGFPSLSPSDQLPAFLDIQDADGKETVTDTIKGYFDVTETKQGWRIQEFQLQSADGSY